MSRTDGNDSERASAFGEHDTGYTGFAPFSVERRPSQGLGGHSTPLTLSANLQTREGQQERDSGSGYEESALGPNRHNPNGSNLQFPSQPISALNHHLQLYRSPPSPNSPSFKDHGTLYQSSPINDRDTYPWQVQPSPPIPLPSSSSIASRSTLLWGNFEPWMDEEYAKQVCNLMGWDPVNVKIPSPPPDPSTGQQTNNPGYCFLTFPTPAHAASVLAQINNNGKGSTVMMPNSSKPFVLNWASTVTAPSPLSTVPPTPTAYTPNNQPYQKEYSIFVGDLAPETSNSDLVAVFRNPVLGLRNDREPKFIRPFLSCKSAKIMLDPVTGVSRGYGFVRFTDEADQQRALIEMHGLYCLSRPMRISPATAKHKAPPALEYPQVQFYPAIPGAESRPVTIALPLPNAGQFKSVSAPIAANNSASSLGSNSIQGSVSTNSFGGSSSTGSSTTTNPSPMMTHGFATNDTNGIKFNNGSGTPSLPSEAQLRQALGQTGGYLINEESWKHHAQARAILGNLIGPNGEQLTSTDPYNTTVFVGGLSPLITEETLRTFFAPFGDIHYVKVPVGKHCGFVQFVRKADAERAIEKMQGFPIGGSRIRLSWGRSQYKAAQAAAQAAQAAAMQAHYPTPTIPVGNAMTPEQAIQLLQKLTQQGYLMPAPSPDINNASSVIGTNDAYAPNIIAGLGSDSKIKTNHKTYQVVDSFTSDGFMPIPDANRALSGFSPFCSDRSLHREEPKNREATFTPIETLPHTSKAYTPSFFPLRLQTEDIAANGASGSGMQSPSTHPASATRYGSYLETPDRVNGRPDQISRPSSGQTSTTNSLGEGGFNDLDPMQDLNGTLASLDLDRSWRSSEVSRNNMTYQPVNKSSSPK